MYEVRTYITRGGKNLFFEWLGRLRDHRAADAIDRRIKRIALGNFGDHKSCRNGVWELRVDVGVGYRVYYALDGDIVVLLLCGGDKSSQSADIARSINYWRDWRERSDER